MPNKNPLLVPELRQMLAEGEFQGLKEFCDSVHPAEVAELISPLTAEEVWAIISHANPETRAWIFSELDEDIQVEIVESLQRKEIARLLADMSPDDRADLFILLPEELKETVLPALAQAEREDIRRLTSYEEGTAGSVMTSDYTTLSPNLTASQSIERLREIAPDRETIYYAYVVDDQRRLLGSVSLKDIILAKRGARIGDIMHGDVVYAYVNDDQEEAARKIQKYDLLALPVVDNNDALVGIITYDDAIDIITQENTEDIEKLMGISGSHEDAVYMKTTSWMHFKNRAGWVIFLSMLGLISGYIVQSFEGLLLQFAILATFMPMLADTGGNTGSQSATLVIRALALKEIASGDMFRVLFKEFKVSIMLAILLAGVAYGRVMILGPGSTIPENFSLGTISFAIAVALGLQVVTATMIGALLPIGAAKLKLDPAVVASPALTTIVDITGLLIFFMSVKLILGI
jgi:magnesium transporter